MIVTTPPGKKIRGLKPLAVSPFREIAYYVPYDDGSAERAATTQSGEDWFPAFQDLGRVTVFLAGGPGSGKSYQTSQIMHSFPRTADFILFTSLTEPDGHFDEFSHSRKPDGTPRFWNIGAMARAKGGSGLTPDIVKHFTLDYIRGRGKNPVLIFDDVDKISDKAVLKSIYGVLEDALANGRGHRKHNGEGDVHVIYTGHSLNDYMKTKYVTENCDYVVVFPNGTTKGQYTQLMKKIGVDESLANAAREWAKSDEHAAVFIKKTVPMFISFGDTISLL